MRAGKNKKQSGYLFMASGCAFFLAAFIALVGKQVDLRSVGIMFAGVGVMFIAIGIANLRKVKSSDP